MTDKKTCERFIKSDLPMHTVVFCNVILGHFLAVLGPVIETFNLQNRERVIDKAQAKEDRRQEKKEEGGKRKSSLKKTETKTEPTGEKWDWEDDADDGNLEDIEEEKE